MMHGLSGRTSGVSVHFGSVSNSKVKAWGCVAAAGDLKLDQLRVNQLRLCRQLSGSLEAGPSGVRLHARGLRPDEVRPAWPSTCHWLSKVISMQICIAIAP